ncbi:LOW QUALITY PROTEIN: ubiquitin carboxyl-terminal hydrolase 19-like [Paramacrobiotus metropolitanus]|uniref:LOW QUALITY PROTEIN: ubiquitin carboxyl-terminal hydrolase 19-like n=1 Tax=Paramacrobiotus metropolitanus TaxID=2943436 RepID=UPI00244594D6|nr:LOW QUALITY PROTEIN: ubiquitin carboxyl-terminal hydrolase 19-like [Paramacrobiotus metropolitanus]
MPEASPRRPLDNSPNSKGDGFPLGKKTKTDEEPSRMSFDSDGDASASLLAHPAGAAAALHSVENAENQAPASNGVASPLLQTIQDHDVSTVELVAKEEQSAYFPSGMEAIPPLDTAGETEPEHSTEAMAKLSSQAPPAHVDLSELMDENLSMNSPKPLQTAQEPAEPRPDLAQEPVAVFIRNDWEELPEAKKKFVYWMFFCNNVTWAEAKFSPRKFSLYFTCSDEEFLAKQQQKNPHRRIDKNTVFCYESGALWDRVIPEKCSMTLNPARKGIEIQLVKAKEAFWVSIYGKSVSQQDDEDDLHCMEEGLPASPTFSPPSQTAHDPDSVVHPVAIPHDSDDEEDLFGPRDSAPVGPRCSTPDSQYSSPSYPCQPLQRWPYAGDVSLNVPLQPSIVPAHLRMHYGLTGLNNLGNSCYLGAVVQCLANTKELRDYFLRGYYKKEINRKNPLGSEGRFASVMEETLRNIWSGNRSSYSPHRLRDVMARSNEQFSGYGQQDAQEAMAMIIDSLHEVGGAKCSILNRVYVKPYLNEINSDNRPDEEVAKQTWEYHLSRDNSAIHDLFSGMFKSTLECPECEKKNIKFDLYQCISVPVPKIGVIIDCLFFPRESGKTDADQKILAFRINVNREHSISSHYTHIQSHLGDVTMASVRILVMRRSRDRKSFDFLGRIDKDFECRNLDESYLFLLYEVLTEKTAKEPVKEFVITQHLRVTKELPLVSTCNKCGKSGNSLKRCLWCYLVGYCDKTCQTGDWVQHKPKCSNNHGPSIGWPFVFAMRESQLKATAFYVQVAKMASRYVHYARYLKASKREACHSPSSDMSISPDSLLETERERSVSVDSTTSGALDAVRPASSDVDSGIGSSCSTRALEDVEVWEFRKSIEKSLSGFDPKHFPFVLVPLEKGLDDPWNIYPRDSLMKDTNGVEEQIRKHSLFVLLWNNRPDDRMTFCETRELDRFIQSDESCLTLKKQDERRSFTQQNYEESLEHCIELLTQPEVLSKHNAWLCPTCKQPRQASKQFEIWSLPTVLVFQLKRFCKPTGEMFRRDKIDTMIKYPLNGLDMSKFLVGPGDGGQYLYDLYGVVHHRGSTWYGHYYGHTRCYHVPDTLQDEVGWRCFDDESVELLSDQQLERIVDRGAYLLFYRRRNTDNPIMLPTKGTDEEDEEEDSLLLDEHEEGGESMAWRGSLQGSLVPRLVAFAVRPARRLRSLYRSHCTIT